MKKRLLSWLLVLCMVLGMMPTSVFAAESYELRTLTFEDADYRGDTNYAGGSDWSSLIDEPQYGGPLLYPSGANEAYNWYDKGNTELSHAFADEWGDHQFWGGGHAVSHYASGDVEAYGNYTGQLTVFKQDAQGLATSGGGHNGSDNFAVHFGYVDDSGYGGTIQQSLTFGDGVARVIDHMYVTNICYDMNTYVNGNDYTAAIGENDWVKIVATGHHADGTTATAEIYLVNGPENIVMDWTRWDLSGLGEVTKVEFNVVGSSDNGFGFSQPAYFAYDDVAVRFEKTETITVGEDISIDLRLNDWYTVDLGEHFTADGPLSFEVSDDGESWTAIEGASYNYYPAGSGAQVCFFRAADAEGNVSEVLTLNANVAATPNRVTVTLSVTDGVGGFYTAEETDTILVPTTMTVPYFDLALYGLEGYYYNPRCYASHSEGDTEYDNSQVAGTAETASGVVTVLHAFIYATEVYYLGYSANDAGKGKSYTSGEFQDAVSWTGGVGSSYMSLWDHGTNLNYYIDWAYPEGAPKWGSTSDQIALYGGEDIAIHMIESANAYGSDFAFFTGDGQMDAASQLDELTVYQGEVVELTAVKTVPDYQTFTTEYTAYADKPVWYVPAGEMTGEITGDVWTALDSTDENGLIVIDTAKLAPGAYYIAAEGYDDTNGGTETGAAVLKLTVKAAPQDVAITVTQNEEAVEAVDTGLLYSDVKVYFAEVPAYGSFAFNDDLTEKLGSANRYFGYRNTLPYTVGVDNYQTKKDYSTIVSRYGEIEGLTAENTTLHAIEVSSVAANGWGRGTLQYVLVVEIPVIRVESVTLDQTEVTTWGGSQVQLTATVAPENATFPTVTWASSNTDVAQVSSTGLVSAWMDGTATITATADGVSASFTITVVDGMPVPTVIYSGSDWPIRGNFVSSITAQKVQVTNTLVNGSNYYITLSEDTADDAAMNLVYTIGGSNGTWIKVGDEMLNPDSATGTYEKEETLVEGAAIVKVVTLAYWNDPAGDPNNGYWNSNGSTKTFYFSNTGTFPMAPMMVGSTSTTALAAEGDTWSIDLAPLFQNVSASEVTYQVSIDGAEAVACDANYTYTCDTPGTRTLVFNAVNDYGVSPAYTATITVVDADAIHEVNYQVDGGVIEWFAFTDDQGDLLPDGTTYEWDAETTTWTIVQPMDIDKSGKVNTYYKLVKDDPASTVPCLTGSSLTTGAGTKWNQAIRFMQTDTLVNGFKDAVVYLFEKPGAAVQPHTGTFHFKYERVLPETYFEYTIDGNATLEINGDVGGVNGHSWTAAREVHVALTDSTPDDAIIACTTHNNAVTLVDGAGQFTYKSGPWYNEVTWTVRYQKDNLPTMVEGVESVVDVVVPCLDAYSVDLAEMYTDPDADDALTYEVRVNGGAWTAIEGSAYTYVPETAQSYTLEFRAFDGFVYTADTYTVNITSINSTQLYSVTVDVDGEADFYCFTSVAEDGTILCGDAIAAADNGDGTYNLGVPMNVRRVVVKIGGAVAVVDVSPENTSAVLHKMVLSAETFGGGEADASFTVSGTADIQPIGDGNVFYLIPGIYTFTATPTADFSELWAAATLTEQAVEAPAEVRLVLPVRAAKTITADSSAEVKVYYQRGYYVLDEVEPVVVVENDNLTTTYYYSCPKGNGYSMGYMYFATNGDLIDKAGYMMGKSEFTLSWRGEERTNSYRGEYLSDYGQGSRGDDSVLVNVNAQNHLVLEEGETFRLRSSRIWEVINTDTENVMIEPTYIYTGYDESIITLTNANDVLEGQVCGTGGNNWMDIRVNGAGVTFLEVGYEAIHLVDGYSAGAWGGAGAANDNDFFNAIDPNRTALIVVQTDGMAATDVTFGIDCLSSNVPGNYYEADKAVEWDAEFDTLYFLGDSGEITLSPSVKTGGIAEVAVSSDKGESFAVLTAEDGVYTAEIMPGNNIIRVTKDDGTTAYQLVRGDRIKVELTVQTDLNGNGEADLGDTVRVQLHGLHNPVGKMSGIYNPGFSHGQRLTWTFDGQSVQQQTYYQYNFVTNAYIDVTIPTEAAAEYVLTDGYINFNVFGDAPGNHRNLTDSGRGVNTSAGSAKYTRSLLPDIVIYSCDHGTYQKGRTIKATCELGGYTEYTCAECGVTVQKDLTPALGHSYTAEVTEPTCTEMGYTTHTCVRCAHSYLTAVTEATGHSYGEWTTVKEADCDHAGERVRECLACGEEQSEAILPTGHAYTAEVVAPTCTESGYTVYTCTCCFSSYISDLTEALGHDHVATVIEPTCTEGGYTEHTCSRCGDSFTTDPTAAQGHDWDGLACTRCDAVRENPFVDVPNDCYYLDSVLWAVEMGITNGTTPTTFSPNAVLNRAQAVTMLWRAAGSPAPKTMVNPFADVSGDAFYYEAVLWAVENGITNGVSATRFDPNGSTNRAQAITFLWRYLNKPAHEAENPFADVVAGAWYYDAVLWAVEADVTSGMNKTTFGVGTAANRAHMVTFMYRAMA